MNARILLIEDHAGMAAVTRVLLEKRGGYHVIGPAVTLQAGLELARDERPDAAVVDLTLPDARGDDAPRRLREQHPDGMGIVVFSAMTGVNDEAGAQIADGAVVKGDTQGLLRELASVLR